MVNLLNSPCSLKEQPDRWLLRTVHGWHGNILPSAQLCENSHLEKHFSVQCGSMACYVWVEIPWYACGKVTSRALGNHGSLLCRKTVGLIFPKNTSWNVAVGRNRIMQVSVMSLHNCGTLLRLALVSPVQEPNPWILKCKWCGSWHRGDQQGTCPKVKWKGMAALQFVLLSTTTVFGMRSLYLGICVSPAFIPSTCFPPPITTCRVFCAPHPQVMLRVVCSLVIALDFF